MSEEDLLRRRLAEQDRDLLMAYVSDNAKLATAIVEAVEILDGLDNEGARIVKERLRKALRER